MIYVTGDTHGNQYKWVEQIDTVLNAEDIILVCGDFGIGFWDGRYWSEEMPSEEEYDNARENLEKINYHVDYIITHTAPSETVYYLSTLHKLGIKKIVQRNYL